MGTQPEVHLTVTGPARVHPGPRNICPQCSPRPKEESDD